MNFAKRVVAGPVGPMDWGLRNILLIMEHEDNDNHRHKLLYGVNFYGADFRGDGTFDGKWAVM